MIDFNILKLSDKELDNLSKQINSEKLKREEKPVANEEFNADLAHLQELFNVAHSTRTIQVTLPITISFWLQHFLYDWKSFSYDTDEWHDMLNLEDTLSAAPMLEEMKTQWLRIVSKVEDFAEKYNMNYQEVILKLNQSWLEI